MLLVKTHELHFNLNNCKFILEVKKVCFQRQMLCLQNIGTVKLLFIHRA